MSSPGRGSGTGRLVRAGFVDPAAAERTLSALDLWSGAPTSSGAEDVLLALGDVADPDLAVAALGRLAQAAPDREDLLAALCEAEGLRARLLGVLGTSAALGDHLVVHPRDWQVLADDELVRSRPTLLGLHRTLLRAVGVPDGAGCAVAHPAGSGAAADPRASGTGPAVLAALRAAYRRCLLGLAARDVTGTVTVEEVAAELADLASATLSAGLAVARAGLPPGAAPCRLAVVGLGKCGGRELNYVSDVDVVFVAEPPAPEQDRPAAHEDPPADRQGAEQAAVRTATTLASAMMRVCGEVAWPVDAGLRPEGGAGPLVRTMASHSAYYARWAQTWEFQALLKARPLAGDLALGRQWCDALAPLVWNAAARPAFVEDVQAMRRRVERSLRSAQADRELKLGRGGLRDIEFAVQLLQLVHGRADSSVRSGTTLVALQQLAAGGYVGREDARHLAEAYRWLRTVEHRLQLHRLRRTHLLPADDDAPGLRRIARAAGYRGDAVALFGRERAGYRREVRRLHEKLFYRPLLGAVARLPEGEEQLSAQEPVRLSPQAARVRLTALGFAEAPAALRHLEALTSGVTRRAAIQRTLLPALLGWFAGAADPDKGLLGYRQVSDALGSTPWYLRQLRDEGGVAERLARLLATSRYVADLLVRAPEGVRLLADDAQLRPRGRAALTSALVSAVGRRDDWEAAVLTARGLRRQELLRVACADLLGLADLPAVATALSDMAAAVVQAALVTAVREVEAATGAPLPVRLSVIAMGRLGGLEQSWGSDVDVLFVHDPLPGATEHDAAAVAHSVANELRRLLALPGPDPALQVDADLRPEGRQGPLTRSLSSYAAYYARWSLVWEAQALLRAAPLAGDEALAQEFMALIAPVRWPPAGLSQDAVVEVRRLKARVEAERRPRGGDPRLALKLGKGGLADVEWTAQLLQLRHGADVPGLRTTGTLPALRAAVAADLLPADDAAVLESAWTLSARARDALVLVRGRPADVLPSSGRDLDAVARLLGYGPGSQGDFLDDYQRTTRHARAVVERRFYGWDAAGPRGGRG